MSQRAVSFARHALLLAGCFAVAQLPSAHAQTKVKSPEWKHGMNLKAREAGKEKFDDKTKKFGVEVFLDPNVDKLAYITEGGFLGVVGGTAGSGGKDPVWSHGLELRVRKAGEANFTEKTKKFGIEVFRDENTGNLIYITETGSIAVVAGAGPAPKTVAKPEWRHGLEMPVRKAGEAEFDKASRFGLEVFVDANNGNVIYITEVGTIAVVSGAGLPAQPAKVKAPEWKHAVELKVRSAGEADFNEKTPKIGLEVYFDPNAGKTVLISEKGAISVLNGATNDSKNKNPEWKHGVEMAARKSGQTEFDKTTPKFGVEVYKDDVTGALIYVVQTGAIAAVPEK